MVHMPRLPNIETPRCESDDVASYISDREEIKRQVAERHAAKKLADAELNGLRKRYAKERGLFTPGVDFILNLLEEFKPESAREWLRGFDVAREVTRIDERLGEQGEMFQQHDREVRADDLAEAVA